MKDSYILVTGASGNVGFEVCKQLVQKRVKVRACTRNPMTLQSRKRISGLEWTEFSYERRDTFNNALSDVEKLFLVAPPANSFSDRIVIPFIQEAITRGINHIIFLSAMGVENSEEAPLRKIEVYIENSGVDYTFLRANWFMQNFNTMFLESIRSGLLHLPVGDGQTSFVDVRDIANVTMHSFLDEGHRKKAYTLTGPEALAYPDAIDRISKEIGKEIHFDAVDPTIARREMLQNGLPDSSVNFLLQLYETVRINLTAPVSEDIRSVLGTTASSFEQYVKDYRTSWL
ncbi:MAG: SDR family oxidoreductase [Leptospiraceae bacterium]|nr:SDR family oxidoreductase [Leptospiraceae bacterium]MCP5500357.1 SDR family oxidoreductase [Leptospiraceae bacterium]